METRSWGPPGSLIGHRIALHAGKQLIKSRNGLGTATWEMMNTLYGLDWSELIPRGTVVATARLADACRVLALDLKTGTATLDKALAGTVQADPYGDFRRGRWLWFLEDVQPCKPARGSQRSAGTVELGTGGRGPGPRQETNRRRTGGKLMDSENGGKLEKLTRAVRDAGITTRWLSENATAVLERRYLAKDREGKVIETPLEMFQLVALNLSEAELEYGPNEGRKKEAFKEFHGVMTRLEFLPNSPTLMNAGRELQQLSGCFVLPIEDSLDGIFNAVKQTALIHKSGGGTGFSFSRLRPAGDVVGSTGGVASGPVSFIGAFDAATEVVKQGSTRRGANMAILNVEHPDILDFIRVKREPGKLTNFNISVAVTGEFMEKVRNREEYELVNPRSGEPVSRLNAGDVFDEIVESAWATGDPGIVFLDRINNANPNPQLGQIESTNPCITGDTLIYTSRGMQKAGDLHREQAPLAVTTDSRFATETFQKASNVFSSGIKPVYRLTTHEGYEVRVTEDHRIMTKSGWVHAKDIQLGQAISILNREGGFGSHGSKGMGQILGLHAGNETPFTRTDVLSVFKHEKEPPPDFEEIKHTVPSQVLTGTMEMQEGFLRGIFTIHGHMGRSIRGEPEILLNSMSRPMLLQMQRLLLNLGIASSIYYDFWATHEAKKLPGGQEGSQTCHKMVISKCNVLRFQDRIGFLDGKQVDMEVILESHHPMERGQDHPQPQPEYFTATFKETGARRDRGSVRPDGTCYSFIHSQRHRGIKLRRAATLALRVLQPGLHQPGPDAAVRHQRNGDRLGTTGEDGPGRDEDAGQRHRREPLSNTGDRGDEPEDPAHRAGHHGLGRHADTAGNPVRLG